MVIQVQISQNELMVEISSKSLVRAIGKVLLMNLSRTPIRTHKGDGKWPLFVFFSLYTLPHTSVGLTSCISIVVSV